MKNKRILRIAVLLFAVGAITDSFAQSGVKYPYVQNGTKIIVCRDAAGGVKESLLLSTAEKSWHNSKKAVVYNEQSAYNKVSAKFEVAANDAGKMSWWAATGRAGSSPTNATMPTGTGSDGSVCPAGWRLPTQRELILVWVFNSELGGLTSGAYWTAAERSSYTIGAETVRFDSGYSYGATGGTDKVNTYTNVRCIRDL